MAVKPIVKLVTRLYFANSIVYAYYCNIVHLSIAIRLLFHALDIPMTVLHRDIELSEVGLSGLTIVCYGM